MMRPPALALVVSIENAAVGNLSGIQKQYASVDENHYARSTAADKR
ncbi:MAG TPA: hypothetical protein VEN78_16710 [Bradyrhizobium sp.]|jgi:hypothetical protein|nr:hypothetical protein [Bradyrhizobium sp.]